MWVRGHGSTLGAEHIFPTVFFSPFCILRVGVVASTKVGPLVFMATLSISGYHLSQKAGKMSTEVTQFGLHAKWNAIARNWAQYPGW